MTREDQETYAVGLRARTRCQLEAISKGMAGRLRVALHRLQTELGEWRRPGQGQRQRGNNRSRIDGELRPGDRVQVRSRAEIFQTLDSEERCGGLPYMSGVMDQFCGESFVVRKKVDLFFDERSWRLRKLRRVVILDGVHCEPAVGTADPWAGCTRTCFCFWKEDWLERLPDPPAPERSARMRE